MTLRHPGRAVHTLVAACLVAVSCGGPAWAEDDIAGPGDERPSKSAVDAAPATVADEDSEGPFVVSLVNGDRITGTLVGLDERTLRFKPDAAVDAAVDVPLARVDDVGRSVPAEPFEPRGDRVYPVTGGVIHGELEGIDAQGITIDAHLVGTMKLPLETVAAFVRDGVEQPERTAPARFHEIHDASGSRLVGHVDFAPTGLAVTAEGLAATVALRQVDVILFPSDQAAADGENAVEIEGEGEADADRLLTLELANGSEIIGRRPQLEQDRIVVELGGGKRVPVPLEHVSRMSFGSEGGPAGGRRRVVFWSTFADTEEEAAHMVEALREGLPRGWQVEADGEFAGIADLAEALGKAGVLVVPEMEEFEADEAPDTEQIGALLRGFLTRGGTIVVAGLDDSTASYWEATGLFSVTSSDRQDDGSFTFVRGHPLAAGAGESFEAVNGTSAYETEDEDLVPVARQRDGAAAVLAKRVGRGSIVILGMDYFERSDAIDRVLVNAATAGRGR